MKNCFLASFFLVLFCFGTPNFAANSDDSTLAKDIIHRWFVAMQQHEIDKAASFLSPQFLSVHTDGRVRDKEQELALIKRLHMKEFHLSDFKVTKTKDVLVVTYLNQGKEKIDNKEMSAKKAIRMAVLQKNADNWQIIAYANLNEFA